MTWTDAGNGYDLIDDTTGLVIASITFDHIEHGWLINGDRSTWRWFLADAMKAAERRSN